jgi:signal transduction histidine kinase
VQRFLEREQQFTADVSHELRTPLTVILGAAEVVKIRALQSGDQPSQDAAERILRTAREAGSLVAAFLLLSRSPNREFSPQLALLPLLEREVEQQRLALGNKPVTLELNVDAHPIVHGAPELVSATIGNLVRNACQYTTEGFVTVTLRPDRVVVEDSGPGLSSALREKLLSSTSLSCPEPAHGSGRGLSIVYRVAEHLGWQVVHEQSPSGGTRFTVLFTRG